VWRRGLFLFYTMYKITESILYREMCEMKPYEGVSISFDDFKIMLSEKQLNKIKPNTRKAKMVLLSERSRNIMSCSEKEHAKIYKILRSNYDYIVKHKKIQDNNNKRRIAAYKNFPNLESIDEAMVIYNDCIAGQIKKPTSSNYAVWGKNNYDKLLVYNHILYRIIKHK